MHRTEPLLAFVDGKQLLLDLLLLATANIELGAQQELLENFLAAFGLPLQPEAAMNLRHCPPLFELRLKEANDQLLELDGQVDALADSFYVFPKNLVLLLY